MPSIEAMVRRPKTSPSAGKPVSVIVAHRIFPGHWRQGLRRSAKVVVEDLSMSAAAEAAEGHVSRGGGGRGHVSRGGGAVAVAVVGDVEAGAVPTSASRKTSSRWCGSTMVSNSIASATRAAIELLYVGVMAQEVQQIEPSAVWRDHDGYLMVNYDRIGVKFMTWKEWLAQNGASSLP